MKHIKEFEQFVSEVKSYPNGPKYSDLEWRDALKGFDSDRYKMVRFSYDDEGNNATAPIDKKNKKVISYSLTGKSEVDQYQKLVKESLNEAQKTSFKKGDKLTIDMGDGPEEVTVMGDIDAGISRIKFVSLKRKAGAPYTITVNRLMNALVESEDLMEAQKYNIEAAVKKIRDFNRGAYKKHGNNAVEELALDILDDLQITLTGGNVDDTIDHL